MPGLRTEKALQSLSPDGFSIGSTGCPKHGNKDLCRHDFAGFAADNGDGHARLVNKQLFAAPVLLAHRMLLLFAQLIVEESELSIAVMAMVVDVTVFLPEHLLGHPLLLKGAVNIDPARISQPLISAVNGFRIELTYHPSHLAVASSGQIH